MVSVHRPSRSALAARARTMLEQMTDRMRWIYALPPEEAAAHLVTVLMGHGLRRDDERAAEPIAASGDPLSAPAEPEPSPSAVQPQPIIAPSAEPNPSRWVTSDESGSFTVLLRNDLEVTLVEARGAEAVAPLSDLLGRTGFFAQSALLDSAFEIGTEDSRRALMTLAHMVVAWDDDWNDLFLLHLASPDPMVRHDAVTALCVAAMVARSQGPAPELLSEASRRESFPKLKETIEEAKALLATLATT